MLERCADPRVTAEFRAAQVELVLAGRADGRRPDPASSPRPGDAIVRRARRRASADRGAGRIRSSLGPLPITDRPRYRLIAARASRGRSAAGSRAGSTSTSGSGTPTRRSPSTTPRAATCPSSRRWPRTRRSSRAPTRGLASTRLKLVEDLSRAATPPAFASWRDFDAFVSWGAAGGHFPDLTYLWWDLRPRPDLGTLEFRFADAQTFVDHSAALVARLPVARLRAAPAPARRRAAAGPPDARDRTRTAGGPSATGSTPCSSTRTRASASPSAAGSPRLLLELEPYAAELGCIDELDEAWPMLGRNGAARQRDVAGVRGIDGLTAWLADETEAPQTPQRVTRALGGSTAAAPPRYHPGFAAPVAR